MKKFFMCLSLSLTLSLNAFPALAAPNPTPIATTNINASEGIIVGLSFANWTNKTADIILTYYYGTAANALNAPEVQECTLPINGREQTITVTKIRTKGSLVTYVGEIYH